MPPAWRDKNLSGPGVAFSYVPAALAAKNYRPACPPTVHPPLRTDAGFSRARHAFPYYFFGSESPQAVFLRADPSATIELVENGLPRILRG